MRVIETEQQAPKISSLPIPKHSTVHSGSEKSQKRGGRREKKFRCSEMWGMGGWGVIGEGGELGVGESFPWFVPTDPANPSWFCVFSWRGCWPPIIWVSLPFFFVLCGGGGGGKSVTSKDTLRRKKGENFSPPSFSLSGKVSGGDV